MNILTPEILLSVGACAGEVSRLFNGLSEIKISLSNLEKARANGFDIYFCERLMCGPALAEYEKVRDAALAEYEKVRGAALAEHEKVCGAAWAEYEKVHGPAWAEYEKVCDAAWAEYEKVRDPALAEYEKVRDAAWAEYEKVRDADKAEYEKVRDAALITALKQTHFRKAGGHESSKSKGC